MTTIENVTAFITCPYQHEHFLLLFEHPHAGVQIPAGAVEPDETAEAAAHREAAEETGLAALTIRQYLGAQEEVLPAGIRLFTLFWAPLHALPPIVSPQPRWLERLRRTETLPPFPIPSPPIATSTRTVDPLHKSPARQKSD